MGTVPGSRGPTVVTQTSAVVADDCPTRVSPILSSQIHNYAKNMSHILKYHIFMNEFSESESFNLTLIFLSGVFDFLHLLKLLFGDLHGE